MENESIKNIMLKELKKEGYDGYIYLSSINIVDRFKEALQAVKNPKCSCIIDKDFMKCLDEPNKSPPFTKCFIIYKVECNHDQKEECSTIEFCINIEKSKCPYKD